MRKFYKVTYSNGSTENLEFTAPEGSEIDWTWDDTSITVGIVEPDEDVEGYLSQVFAILNREHIACFAEVRP